MLSILKAICLFFDGLVYSFVSYAFNLFLLIAKLNFSFISAYFEPIIDRLETLILVLILFKLGISFITYMLKPDEFQDKSKGGVALIKNVFIVAILLITYKFVFDVFNEFSMLIIGYNSGDQFTVLNQIAGVEANPEGDKGFLTRFVFGNNEDVNNFGQEFAKNILLEFMSGKLDGQEVGEYIDSISSGNNFSLIKLCTFHNDDLDYHFPILSTAVGIYFIYSLIQMCIQVGIRVFKLIVLRIVAPAVIVTMIDDGFNSQTFKNYYKVYFSEYASLFVRIFVMYLVISFIGLITNNISGLVSADTDALTKSFASIILMVAAFRFAGQLPAFIDSIIGSKLASGGNTGMGFGHFMAGLGGAVLGAGTGLAAGLATKAGVAGTLGNMVAGGFGGASSGARSNNVADFFRNSGETSQANRDRASRIARQGGGLAYAGAGIENFLGVPQRQAQQAQVLADDNTLIDNVLNAQANEIKNQEDGNGLKYGDNADSYGELFAQNNSGYLEAQQAADDMTLQRQAAIERGETGWDGRDSSIEAKDSEGHVIHNPDGTTKYLTNAEHLAALRTTAKREFEEAKEKGKKAWNDKASGASGREVKNAKNDLMASGRGDNTRKLDSSSSRDKLESTKKSNETERQEMMSRGATRRSNRQGTFGGN